MRIIVIECVKEGNSVHVLWLKWLSVSKKKLKGSNWYFEKNLKDQNGTLVKLKRPQDVFWL